MGRPHFWACCCFGGSLDGQKWLVEVADFGEDDDADGVNVVLVLSSLVDEGDGIEEEAVVAVL